MRAFPLMLMLAALALASSAAAKAEDDRPERPDDAAWVEDCPEGMMCAAGADEDGPTYADCGDEVCAYDEEPTRGPADGSCERCRGEAYGPDDCIECSGPVGETCMDGSAPADRCDPDVQYLDGGTRTERSHAGGGLPPADAVADETAKDVPAAGILLVGAAVGTVVLLVARRR